MCHCQLKLCSCSSHSSYQPTKPRKLTFSRVGKKGKRSPRSCVIGMLPFFLTMGGGMSRLASGRAAHGSRGRRRAGGSIGAAVSTGVVGIRDGLIILPDLDLSGAQLRPVQFLNCRLRLLLRFFFLCSFMHSSVRSSFIFFHHELFFVAAFPFFLFCLGTCCKFWWR